MKFTLTIEDLERLLDNAKNENEYHDMLPEITIDCKDNVVYIYQKCYYGECYPTHHMTIRKDEQ